MADISAPWTKPTANSVACWFGLLVARTGEAGASDVGEEEIGMSWQRGWMIGAMLLASLVGGAASNRFLAARLGVFERGRHDGGRSKVSSGNRVESGPVKEGEGREASGDTQKHSSPCDLPDSA